MISGNSIYEWLGNLKLIWNPDPQNMGPFQLKSQNSRYHHQNIPPDNPDKHVILIEFSTWRSWLFPPWKIQFPNTIMKISPVSYASWLDFLDKDTNFSQVGIFKGNHTKSQTSNRRFINRYWFYLSSLIKKKIKWFTNFQCNRIS